MKKLASLLLTLVMITSCFSAMAGEVTTPETGSITINNAVAEQTYTIYQILDLESYSDVGTTTDEDGNYTGGNFVYKATAAWANFINSSDIKGVYVNVDEQGYVTWVENAKAAEFAKLAKEYAKANNIAPSAEPITASSATVKFENVDLGYYLVDSTLGTLCSLDTTNPNVVMKEKNEAPSITKEVQEDSDSSWGDNNDADTNQVVNYQATITVQTGAENYVMHDKMSSGLNFNTSSVKVTVNGTEVAASDGTYTVNITPNDDCTFEVIFADSYVADLDADTKIVVSYSAVLNENAVVGNVGNPNEVKLEYGDENKHSYTPVDKTITYTWDHKVVKYTTVDGNAVKLANAKFEIYTDEACENILSFHALTAENEYELCVDTNCTKEHVTEITTDESGTFRIEGLDAGIYYLNETAAPAGYNKLPDPVKFEVTVAEGEALEDGTKTLTSTTGETKVENNAGVELPETGGMGTTLLYVGGGILVLAAIVLLIAKRRTSAE